MALVPRWLEHELRDILRVSRGAALLGPRQSGKSTLALRLADAGVVPNVYSLDQEDNLRAAREDPLGFVTGLARPAVLDEVQRAPEIMLPIKQVLDSSDEPGQFLLTGSANLVAMASVADALPGRVEYANLWPFSQGELAGRRETFIDAAFSGDVPRLSSEEVGRSAYAERIVTGGFPAAQGLSHRRRRGFFDSYLQTIAARDIPDLSSGSSASGRGLDLVRLLATRSAGLVNLSSLAGDLGVSAKTAGSYLDLLERMFLVHRVQPWSVNVGKRQVKTPKAYLVDSGMMASLINLDEKAFAAPDRGEIAGAVLETFVVNELVKQSTWAEEPVRLHFYRDSAGREVDVVLESASGDVVGIEVKATASTRPPDTRGLRFLAEKLGRRFRVGIVLFTGPNTVHLGDRLWAVPVSSLWA